MNLTNKVHKKLEVPKVYIIYNIYALLNLSFLDEILALSARFLWGRYIPLPTGEAQLRTGEVGIREGGRTSALDISTELLV